jgi:dipeptidyl aminopeptidase/acylaminoacyl peptidase
LLITAGEKDHFVPVGQVDEFKQGLKNARSITVRIFTEEEGGHEQCQIGALSLFHEELFEWIEKRF